MTPLSKKAFWILFTLLSLTLLAIWMNVWTPLFVMSGFILLVILLNGLESLNALFFFSIPLSMELKIPGIGDMMFPSEFIALVIGGFVVLNFFAYRRMWRKEDFHPVTGSLLLLWFGLLLGTITSNMPIVSVKSLIIFTLYTIVFYLQWLCTLKTEPKKSNMPSPATSLASWWFAS